MEGKAKFTCNDRYIQVFAMFDFKDTAVFMSKAATYYILNGMDFSK